MFNLVSGLVLLAASIIAGALWDAVGPQATFLTGAGIAAAAAGGLFVMRHQGIARLTVRDC